MVYIIYYIFLSDLDYIKIETLTDNLQLVPQLDKGIEISFDAVNSKLHIQKFK